MPKLPEVETIARQLRARGVEGRKILSDKLGEDGGPTVGGPFPGLQTIQPFGTE